MVRLLQRFSTASIRRARSSRSPDTAKWRWSADLPTRPATPARSCVARTPRGRCTYPHHTPDGGHEECMVDNHLVVRGDPSSYLGRAVIVHEKQDAGGQPVGNAGGRIGG